MGIIAIEGIDVYAYHGVYPIEREAGNRFLIDLYMDADLRPAAESDALADTIDYFEVYKLVLFHMKPDANLLETLVFRIGPALLERFGQLHSVEVKVRKLSPHAMAQCRETYVAQTFYRNGSNLHS